MLPDKPKNCLQMINQKVISETYQLKRINFGDVMRIEKIVRYRKSQQFFAVGPFTAYDVTPYEFTNDGVFHRYEPITTPATFVSMPNEGRTGILTWYCRQGHSSLLNGWTLIWGPVRWIRTSELDLSPQQVWNNIAEEISRGETPLTGGGPSGWD